jgi:hypothetical protein
MNEFFPVTKTMKVKKQVQKFKQSPLESLGEAWRRFKTLERHCPPDLLHPWDIISSFYGGLTDEGKMLLDSSSRGALYLYPHLMRKSKLKEYHRTHHFGTTRGIPAPVCTK